MIEKIREGPLTLRRCYSTQTDVFPEIIRPKEPDATFIRKSFESMDYSYGYKLPDKNPDKLTDLKHIYNISKIEDKQQLIGKSGVQLESLLQRGYLSNIHHDGYLYP